MLCKFFKYGECKNGDQCKWRHKMCYNNPFCYKKDCPFGHTQKCTDLSFFHEPSSLKSPSAKELQKQIPDPLLLFEPIEKCKEIIIQMKEDTNLDEEDMPKNEGNNDVNASDLQTTIPTTMDPYLGKGICRSFKKKK